MQIKKIILVTGHGGSGSFFADSGAWGSFFLTLKSNDFELATDDSSFDVLIANSHSDNAIAKANKFGVPLDRRFLIVWEPSIVDSKYYEKKVLRHYGHIFSPSVQWNSDLSGLVRNFVWPQPPMHKIDSFETWQHRKNKFVIIQGNKFSARKGELYSLRRQVIQSKKIDIDLFGTNWNEGLIMDFARWANSVRKSPLLTLNAYSLIGAGKRFSNYRGKSESKQNTLNEYRMSIVIENMNNYVSEKLFDSVSAGCLTLYVGPKLEIHGIDSQNILRTNADLKSIEKLATYYSNLDVKSQYTLASEQNRSLMKSQEFLRNDNSLSDLADQIVSLLI